MRKFALLLLIALPLSAQLERTAVLKLPGMESVDVRTNIAYDGDLKLDLYRPRNASNALPVVIFLNGVGRPDLKEWGQYTSWPRLVAARGMAAITHQTSGTDLAPQAEALLRYVREHAAELRIDPKRIALWACSANSRLGTALVANHADFRAAVFYYGLMEAAPKNDVTPVLVARAGLDALTLNDSIDRWVASAVALDAPVTLLTYPEGRHAFDVDQDTIESKRVIEQTLDFLKHYLTTGPTPRIEPMSMSQLQRLVREEGHARAIATLESFRKTHPKAYVLEEQALNSLG
ncbi:MAG TPA: dienelactone hydrolase family protein, partial [Thermoanaerobaculia bacterium]